MAMRITSMKENFDTAVKLKARHEAVCFVLSIIEGELKDIVESDDFNALPYDTQHGLVVPRAKAIKFWKIQLNTFMDKNIESWINVAAKSRSEELKTPELTLESVLKRYGVADKIAELPVEETPVPVAKPKSRSQSSDDEILNQLMSQQN